MVGRTIGSMIASARDGVARGMLKLGVTPDTLTIVGMVLTAGAAVCYAIGAGKSFGWNLEVRSGANAYLLLGFVLLLLSCGCDMVDGAVARLGNKSTRFGAFLDSTLDRYSDFVVYAGIAAYYAWLTPANITFVLLCMIAFFNAFMISYTRARAEDLIESCRVGYWQRGERSTAILIATAAYNIPGLVVQQAVLPLLTVLRRIFHTRAVLNGKKPITDPREGNFWLKIRLWRWNRGSVPYDFVTALNIAWVLFARIPSGDPLRSFLS
jgi:CDP-diacylglycerol--glycerol-3-phosphate 3-phosphatidyltransferase